MSIKNRNLLIVGIMVFLLLIDQVLKFYIKLNMTIGQEFSMFGEWGKILFIENNGMAFGMQFGGVWGKVLLTVFRLVFICILGYYLFKAMKKESTPTGVLVCGGMILVGAIGNEIDSIIYGVIFSESTYSTVASLFPDGGGYSGLMLGKVVDMFYFPMINTTWPHWVPFVGGEELVFFRPVFNFADSCITCAMFYLILFQRKFFISMSEKDSNK